MINPRRLVVYSNKRPLSLSPPVPPTPPLWNLDFVVHLDLMKLLIFSPFQSQPVLTVSCTNSRYFCAHSSILSCYPVICLFFAACLFASLFYCLVVPCCCFCLDVKFCSLFLSCQCVMYCLAQQASEKIDRTRAHAGEIFLRLLYMDRWVTCLAKCDLKIKRFSKCCFVPDLSFEKQDRWQILSSILKLERLHIQYFTSAGQRKKSRQESNCKLPTGRLVARQQ